MNPVVYIFINKSLHMSAGKLGAQAAHAMAHAHLTDTNWWKKPHRTILIMEARDGEHMNSIQMYLLQREIPCNIVIDEGANEIDPHTPTALSTIVLNKDDAKIKKIMSTFKLYRDPIKVTMEVER